MPSVVVPRRPKRQRLFVKASEQQRRLEIERRKLVRQSVRK